MRPQGFLGRDAQPSRSTHRDGRTDGWSPKDRQNPENGVVRAHLGSGVSLGCTSGAVGAPAEGEGLRGGGREGREESPKKRRDLVAPAGLMA